MYDAAVVGGGFFGCSIACHLARRMKSVVLFEQGEGLFGRASYANQARIHNGYHYPRSLNTAYRSHANFATFVQDYREAVVSDFTKLYCVSRHDSKVTPRQFERFCDIIGAPWKPARQEHVRLFDKRLIEAVYEVTEYAFNSTILRQIAERQLALAGVEVRTATSVESVETDGRTARIHLAGGGEEQSRYVFNCAYAGMKYIPGLSEHCRTAIKVELTEMALITPPPELADVGVTVMCGPFFSVMPFPPRGLHTLSHVRYTPHCSWVESDASAMDPRRAVGSYAGGSRSRYMLNDSQRYLPGLAKAKIVDSLWETKAILLRNELDDGRPILMERSETAPNVYSIMGGKLDNIYDVIQRLSAEAF